MRAHGLLKLPGGLGHADYHPESYGSLGHHQLWHKEATPLHVSVILLSFMREYEVNKRLGYLDSLFAHFTQLQL